MTPLTGKLPQLGVLISLLVLASGQALASSNSDVAKVNSAIESIRGHDSRDQNDKISSKALDEELDKAWEVLTKYPSISKKRIPDILADEQSDQFLLIDLSHLYMLLRDGDADSMASASAWLLRADPNYYPTGYFQAASLMGSKRCEPCLRAVLGLLKLEKLGASIPEHALSVDLDMGLLFAIGPYGSGATDALIAAYGDQSCAVRKNAVRMTHFLLDPAAVPALRTVAMQDSCMEARNEAWTALGDLADPQLDALIQQRIGSREAVPSEEKLIMIRGLGILYRRPDTTVLKKLADDPDSHVSEAATKLLSESPGATDADHLMRNVGSKSSTGRAKATGLLKAAIHDGRFKFDGSALDLEAMLSPADLPTVNEARASVLRRASDECLYEWKKLYLAGFSLVQMTEQDQVPETQ